jgi:hypothetical protein
VPSWSDRRPGPPPRRAGRHRLGSCFRSCWSLTRAGTWSSAHEPTVH